MSGWTANGADPVPGDVSGAAGLSLAGKALEDGLWALETVDIRDFARDRHQTVDDAPFGGGAGMVMRPDVVDAAIDGVEDRPALVLYLTPRGRPLTRRGSAIWPPDRA